MTFRRAVLTILLGTIGLVIVLPFVLGWLLDEALPQGRPGPEADALARSVQEAVNHEAWQNTRALRWNFFGQNEHLWDRDRHLARVRTDKLEVLLDLNDQSGMAWREGAELEGEEADQAIAEGYRLWLNDSFWLNPIAKFFDAGVERSIVTLQDVPEGAEPEALLVRFTEGGLTPGDAYLWILDANHRPIAWKMWVSLSPIGGLETSWDAWTTLSTGALVAQQHKTFMVDINIVDIEGAHTLSELEEGRDPFEALTE